MINIPSIFKQHLDNVYSTYGQQLINVLPVLSQELVHIYTFDAWHLWNFSSMVMIQSTLMQEFLNLFIFSFALLCFLFLSFLFFSFPLFSSPALKKQRRLSRVRGRHTSVAGWGRLQWPLEGLWYCVGQIPFVYYFLKLISIFRRIIQNYQEKFWNISLRL